MDIEIGQTLYVDVEAGVYKDVYSGINKDVKSDVDAGLDADVAVKDAVVDGDWLVVLGFNTTLTAKVISWRSVTHMCFLAFSHQY